MDTPQAKAGDWFRHHRDGTPYYVGLVVPVDDSGQLEQIDEIVIYGDLIFSVEDRVIVAKNPGFNRPGKELPIVSYFVIRESRLSNVILGGDAPFWEREWEYQLPVRIWGRSAQNFNGFTTNGVKRFVLEENA